MSPLEIYHALVDYYEVEKSSFERERVHRLALTTEGKIEVVYSRPEVDHPIGLRIQTHPELDDEVARIIAGHLGEPLGSFMESLEFDDEGVGWWEGEPIEWWYS